jgi:hypothetical protein
MKFDNCQIVSLFGQVRTVIEVLQCCSCVVISPVCISDSLKIRECSKQDVCTQPKFQVSYVRFYGYSIVANNKAYI